MILLDFRQSIEFSPPKLKEDESCWIIFNREDFQKLYQLITQQWQWQCHLENWIRFSVLPSFQRIDVFHVTQSNQYYFQTIKYKRPCVTPYTVNGRPRGWEYDEDGQKIRWTGLGNVFFLKSEATLKTILEKISK